MRRRRRLPACLLALVLAFAGAGVAWVQENPMATTVVPLDDEPESADEPAETPVPAPGPATPATPTTPATPESSDGRRMVTSPLPPQRPWTMPGGAPPPAAAPAAQPPAVAAPSAPSAPASQPAQPPVPAEAPPSAPSVAVAPMPQYEMRPDMRVLPLPAQREPATTEEIEAEEERAPEPTFVEKQTDYVDIACIRPEVMALVRRAGEHFGGTPVITSGQRNRGRRGSFHRRCMAADFFVPGVERASLARYLRAQAGAGGVGTYCHTKSVHIDIGEPRNWYQCGRRFRFAQR